MCLLPQKKRWSLEFERQITTTSGKQPHVYPLQGSRLTGPQKGTLLGSLLGLHQSLSKVKWSETRRVWRESRNIEGYQEPVCGITESICE